MKERFKHVHSRRELCAGLLRYASLGMLAAGAAGVFAKRRRLVRQGKCTDGGTCVGCEMLAQCELPRAMSAREALIGGENVRE